MTGKFIVGVDGSETSRKALIWASRLAAGTDAVVEPVLSWQYPATISTAFGGELARRVEDLESVANAQMEILVAGTREFCHPDATITEGLVAHGAPGAVLCDLANDADLLVVGSRGHGGFKGMVLGSVSSHCANAAPCPVAIVPSGWATDGNRGAVVVGVDGSDNSANAVAWADQWAPPDAVLRLVHCWTYPIAYDAQMFDYDPALLERAAGEMVIEAEAYVKNHKTETVVVSGDAREKLGEQTADSDMLVIGARGNTGMVRVLLGSVASATVRHLSVPTVVVHPPPTPPEPRG